MPSRCLNAPATPSYLHCSTIFDTGEPEVEIIRKHELAPFWSSGISPFSVGSPALISVAALRTATETEGTAAILQQCESGTPTTPQIPSGVAAPELPSFDARDSTSTMGSEA